MKQKIVLLLLAGMFMFVSCEENLFTRDEVLNPIEKSSIIGVGTVVTEMIHSEALEGNLLQLPADRELIIYLPKSYEINPEKRFPVIYFLHGMPAWGNMLIEYDPFENFFNYAQLQAPVDFPEEGFTDWVNNLIESDGMREVIIVMPDAQTLLGPCLYQNSEILGNFEDYIVNDVVAFIDCHFRTIAHSNWRAITGHCTGAYGALNIAMNHPHVFNYAGALSPPHFPEATMQMIALYMQLEDQISGFEGPVPYDPYQSFKFMNATAYFLAQFWLPNLNNPPYFCDLPFEYIDGQPLLIPELVDKFNAQSLMALTAKNKVGLRQLKTIYFDCGEYDELGMYQPNQMLHKQLFEMNIKHEYATYPGTHISNLYDRLGKVWTTLSTEFPEAD